MRITLIRVFDQDGKGTIRFHELLLAFSMSMRGSGKPNIVSPLSPTSTFNLFLAEEKLKWAFRLYGSKQLSSVALKIRNAFLDIDRSGKVEQDEFESIFETLCK